MLIKDLEFQNGELVKIKAMRPEYLNGNDMIKTIKELAKLVDKLDRQLLEVLGTAEEYVDLPVGSLFKRHLDACKRASLAVEKIK